MSGFRFDCVFYYVRELDAAIRFYTTALGFELESRDVVARFRVNGVLFELVPTDEPAVLSGRGNARLTLSVDDLESTLEMLRRNDVRTSGIREVSNGRLAELYDPDGNEVVLWQYATLPWARTE